MTMKDEEYREKVKENYDFSSWAGKTKRPEARPSADFNILFDTLNDLQLEERKDLPLSYGEKRAIRYIYSCPESITEDRVVITTYEFESVGEAHEGLINAVMTYMAPTLPTCESKGIEIGDVCFGCHSDIQTSLIFARSNILVEIDSIGTHDLSVVEFAQKVDQTLKE